MVNLNDKCSCSKCHSYFLFSELEEKEQSVYGIKIKSKVCPECGAAGWSAVKDEKWFDKYDCEKYAQRYY